MTDREIANLVADLAGQMGRPAPSVQVLEGWSAIYAEERGGALRISEGAVSRLDRGALGFALALGLYSPETRALPGCRTYMAVLGALVALAALWWVLPLFLPGSLAPTILLVGLIAVPLGFARSVYLLAVQAVLMADAGALAASGDSRAALRYLEALGKDRERSPMARRMIALRLREMQKLAGPDTLET